MRRIVTGLAAVALAAGLAACNGGHPTPVHTKYESLLTWLNNAPSRLPPAAVLPGGAALLNESYGVDLNGRYTLRTDTTLSTPLSFMCVSDSKESVSLGVRASDRDTTVVYGQLNCVGEIGRIHIGQKKTDVRALDDNPVVKAVAAQIGSLPGSNSPVTGRLLTDVLAAARANWMGPTGHGAHSPSVAYQSLLRWSANAASTDVVWPTNGATRRYDDAYHAKPNGRYALRATGSLICFSDTKSDVSISQGWGSRNVTVYAHADCSERLGVILIHKYTSDAYTKSNSPVVQDIAQAIRSNTPWVK